MKIAIIIKSIAPIKYDWKRKNFFILDYKIDNLLYDYDEFE